LIPGGIPDKETQIKFIQKILRTVRYAKQHQSVVLFLDPTHQVHNVSKGYAWQEKGKRNTRVMSSNTGRRRINILGALNAVDLEPTTLITESNCDAEMLACLLEQIRKQYPRAKKIYIFLDNAKYNHGSSVKHTAKKLGIKLIFLPPYCPNLNLIERLWKFLKKKIRYNQYHDTFIKFEQAIHDFFKHISQYDAELKSLLTLNFEII
jgi:transposase